MNGTYICAESEDKKIVGVYCYKGGDITNTGAILLDYYTDRAKAMRLIVSGDLVRLAPDSGNCKRYVPARGARTVYLQDLFSDPWIENVYLFTLSGEWLYMRRDGSFNGVEHDLNGIFEEAGIVRPDGFFGTLNQATVNILRSSKLT